MTPRSHLQHLHPLRKHLPFSLKQSLVLIKSTLRSLSHEVPETDPDTEEQEQKAPSLKTILFCSREMKAVGQSPGPSRANRTSREYGLPSRVRTLSSGQHLFLLLFCFHVDF